MSDKAARNNLSTDRYWSLVKLCLRKFHGLTGAVIQRKVTAIRNRIEESPRSYQSLFFHVEPFNTACTIAGHDIRDDKILNEYVRLRDKPNDHGTNGTPKKRGRVSRSLIKSGR